jgi:hypothetical protein
MTQNISEEGLKRLILFITRKSQDVSMTLTRIRLVKLLYLIDEAYYNKFGRLYTGFKWIYHYYGPYTHDLNKIKEKIVGVTLKERQFEDGSKEGFSYTTREEINSSNLEGGVDEQVFIDGIVENWTKKDTYSILEYVYEESPPMWGVDVGEKLRFENIDDLKNKIEEEKKIIENIVKLLKSSNKWQDLKKIYKEKSKGIKIKRDISELAHKFILDLED